MTNGTKETNTAESPGQRGWNARLQRLRGPQTPRRTRRGLLRDSAVSFTARRDPELPDSAVPGFGAKVLLLPVVSYLAASGKAVPLGSAAPDGARVPGPGLASWEPLNLPAWLCHPPPGSPGLPCRTDSCYRSLVWECVPTWQVVLSMNMLLINCGLSWCQLSPLPDQGCEGDRGPGVSSL